MSYKKWNDAFIKHFFSENKANEVILNIDEDIINKIGSANSIGNINHYIEICFPDLTVRHEIFDLYFPRRRDVSSNRKMQTRENIDFGQFLGEFTKENNKTLPFLNFVLLKILAKNICKKSSHFDRLDKLKNPTDFDLLFYEIQKYDPRFIIRRLGKHRYEGLIRYQIVLNSNETDQLESILYANHIIVPEDTSFVEVLNKLLPFLPNNSSLRAKVLGAIKDRAYATFFLNKVKSFNHNNFTSNDSGIRPVERAYFAFAFRLESEQSLHLLTNLSQTSSRENENPFTPFIDEDYCISLDNNRISDGYSPNPVELNSKVDFNKKYKLETADFLINSITLDEVNFFQKTVFGYFLQTKTPQPNTDTFIVVKNGESEIKRFENWVKNPSNTKNISDRIANESTKYLFGKNWVIYEGNGPGKSIDKPYYKATEFIDKLSFKGKEIDLDISIKGGYKVKDMEKTYLDVALPSFLLEFPNFDKNNFLLNISESTKGIKKFNEIGYDISDGVLKLHYNNVDYHMEKDHYHLTFSYTVGKSEYKKTHEFSVIASKMFPLDESEYFKLNKWGKKSESIKNYYNGIRLTSNTEKINLNNNQKTQINIGGLKGNFNIKKDYFINLLPGVFQRQNNRAITRSIFNNIINDVVKHYEESQIHIEHDRFSNANLIHNLIALGYLNKDESVGFNTSESFQLNPPTFIKIERAFTPGGRQLYKLVGARTKLFTQKLLWYCEQNLHPIKFGGIIDTDERKLEFKLLPEQIFIEGINLEHFGTWIKEQELEGLVFFNKEDTHHVGDSLLSFIASVSDFEKEWIKPEESLRITDNEIYSDSTRNDFPRIREMVKATGNPPIRHKVLEIQKGKILKLKLKHWMEFYVRHKHNEVVMVMKRPRDNNGAPCYDNEDEMKTFTSFVYFYKYYPLPSLFYKVLVSINHRLPKSEKVFIINSPLPEKDKTFAYNEFMVFNLSNKVERRKQVSRIITGSQTILSNPQIAFTDKYKGFKMFHHSGAKLNSDFDQFTTITDNEEKIIAITSLRNKVYVSAEYLEIDFKLTISITSPNSIGEYRMVELNIAENINKLLSLILIGNKLILRNEIKETATDKTLFYNIKEEVIIKRHTPNE